MTSLNQLRQRVHDSYDNENAESGPVKTLAAQSTDPLELGRVERVSLDRSSESATSTNVSWRRVPTHPYNSVDPHGRGGLGGPEVTGQWAGHHVATRPGRAGMIHTIFEGTSEVQQLVIAPAISGMRIE